MCASVGSDYEDIDAITASSLLISYTIDVRPSEEAQLAIRDWVNDGGVFLRFTAQTLLLISIHRTQSDRLGASLFGQNFWKPIYFTSSNARFQ